MGCWFAVASWPSHSKQVMCLADGFKTGVGFLLNIFLWQLGRRQYKEEVCMYCCA